MDQDTSEAASASTPPAPGASSSQQQKEQTPPASETFKATARDAWDSVKGLWANPETGQANALEKLGSQKSMLTGFFIIASIAILNYLLVRISLPHQFAPLFTIENSIRLVGLWVFPSMSLVIVFIAVGKILRRERSYKDYIFLSGMINIPLVLPMAGLVVFGYSNPEIVFAIVVAALCFMTLLTYASYRHVLDCTPRRSFVLTPLTLLGMVYITSILSRSWMGAWLEALIN